MRRFHQITLKPPKSSIPQSVIDAFAQLDQDGDGRVTWEELISVMFSSYGRAVVNEIIGWPLAEVRRKQDPKDAGSPKPVAIDRNHASDLKQLFDVYDKRGRAFSASRHVFLCVGHPRRASEDVFLCVGHPIRVSVEYPRRVSIGGDIPIFYLARRMAELHDLDEDDLLAIFESAGQEPRDLVDADTFVELTKFLLAGDAGMKSILDLLKTRTNA